MDGRHLQVLLGAVVQNIRKQHEDGSTRRNDAVISPSQYHGEFFLYHPAVFLHGFYNVDVSRGFYYLKKRSVVSMARLRQFLLSIVTTVTP